MQTVQVKTPLELLMFVWKDGALARPEDLTVAEVIDIRERSVQLRTLPTMPQDDLELLANTRPMWG